MIYILVLIYIISLVIRFPKLDKNANISYWFLFLIFILVAGFRYNVGLDTIYYTSEYQNFPTLDELNQFYIENSNYQILWILFESSIKSLTDSFYFLQIILAIFVNIVVFHTIRKHSINPFFTILLYYLLFYVNLNMEILRESIPICLFLIGIPLLKKKKYINYFILSIIAYFSHESAIILFVFPFIIKLKISKKIYVIGIITLLIFSSILSIYIINNLEIIKFLINENKHDYFDQTDIPLSTQIFNILKYVAIPTFILLLFYEKITDLERKIIFCYVIFSIFSTQFFIFYRIRDYFLIFFLIALTNGFVKHFQTKIGQKPNVFKPLFLFIFLFSFLFRSYYINAPNKHYQIYLNYYPYNFILDEEIPYTRIENMKQIKK